MSAEINKAAKLRFLEAFNQRDVAVFEELTAPEYVLHAPGAPDLCGPGALLEMVTRIFDGLSEIRWTADDMVAEGDTVATRWTLRARHTGVFMGAPPTNQPITVTGATIDRFADGRLVEAWDFLDSMGLLRQLGLPAQ